MSHKVPRICVVGSVNMDLTIDTEIIPKKGETFIGKSFKTHPGGKGANQAVAAARFGADVSMIGAVGMDSFGLALIQNLRDEGINTNGINKIADEASGTAHIIITNNDNRIIFVPGANHHVTPEMVESHKDILLNSEMLLLQLEIPMKTVEYTVKLAHENGIPVIVNPAPFQKMSNELLEKVTYTTPNEVEAAALQEAYTDKLPYEKVIITMGEKGVQFYNFAYDFIHIPAFDVQPVDTTGAGDTFNGVFAVSLSEGYSIEEAVTLANKASALSIGTVGAQSGMPTRDAIEKSFLKFKKDVTL